MNELSQGTACFGAFLSVCAFIVWLIRTWFGGDDK